MYDSYRILLGDVPAREDDNGLWRQRLVHRRSFELAFEDGDLGHPLGGKPSFDEPRKAEGALGHAKAELLRVPAGSTADRAQVFAPILASPELMPVDEEPVANEWSHE